MANRLSTIKHPSGDPRQFLISAGMIVALIGGTGLIAGWITGSASAQNATKEASAAARILPVEAGIVRIEDSYERIRHFPGLIAARRSVDLGFQINGMIAEFSADEGDSVAKGDVLASIDTDRLQADRAQLVAALAENRASVKLARQTRNRQRDLNAKGHASDQTLDEAESELERATAAIAATQARIDRLDVDLADAALVAPFSGTITRRLLDEGAVVTAGASVMRLIETTALEAKIGLPPRIAADLTIGSRLDFDWRDMRRQGVLRTILPSVGRSSRTLTAVIDLPSNIAAQDGELIELVLKDNVQESGFWLPNDALTEGLRGLWSVYTLQPEPDSNALYRTSRAEVEILYAEADRSFVAGTLNDGDHVVWHGAHRLTAGQIVKADPSATQPEG